MRRAEIRSERGGMGPWVWQRVTAVLLLLGLGVHLVVLHAANIGKLTFATSQARLGTVFFMVLDFGLLATALFHGLNGLRMVLLDYGFTGRKRVALDIVLWALGLGAFAFGTWALWPWVAARGKA